jgi:hypothetical protein
MAYSPPVTFLTGATLQSSDLEQNLGAARDYLNAEIQSADVQLGTVTANQLAESVGVAGGQGRRFVLTVKTTDITQQELLLSLPGVSREVVFESAGALLVECTGHVVVVAGDSGSVYKSRTTPTPNQVDSRVYLRIDGVTVANSRVYHFTEESGAPSAQSIASGVADFAAVNDCRRPLYLFHVEQNLGAGRHTVEVVVDTRSELLFLGPVSMRCECLLDCGYTSYTGLDTFEG